MEKVDKEILESLGITNGQTVQHAEVTVQECLNLVLAGKPLPSRAVQNSFPVFNKSVISDNKIADDLTHIEKMRRNLEGIAADVKAIERAKAMQKSVANAASGKLEQAAKAANDGDKPHPEPSK